MTGHDDALEIQWPRVQNASATDSLLNLTASYLPVLAISPQV